MTARLVYLGSECFGQSFRIQGGHQEGIDPDSLTAHEVRFEPRIHLEDTRFLRFHQGPFVGELIGGL